MSEVWPRKERECAAPAVCAAGPARVASALAWRQRGTSLIELMVGLMVLMVVMGVALPSAATLIGRFFTRSGAEDLLYAADLARSRARAQRLSYSLSVGGLGVDGELMHIIVRRGTGSACASAVGGGSTVVYESDWGKDNPRGNPDIAVLRRAPKELGNAGMTVCFKPDGRVVRGDTEMPFSPPTPGYLAGDCYFELTRVHGTTPVGDILQVQIGYNGSSALTYGHDLGALQGAGG